MLSIIAHNRFVLKRLHCQSKKILQYVSPPNSKQLSFLNTFLSENVLLFMYHERTSFPFLQGKYAVKMQRNFTRKILTHCNIRAFNLDFAYLFVIWEGKSEINGVL